MTTPPTLSSDQHELLQRQTAYQQRIYQLYREQWRQYYNADGLPLHPHAGADNILTRGLIWGCLPFLSGTEEDQQLANAILSQLHFHDCTFSPAAAIQLLVLEKEKLSPQSIQILESYLQSSLSYLMEYDKNFRGHNDNHPAMMVFALAIMGEYFEDAHLTQLAWHRLETLRQLKQRRGFPSEYSSPTYTPLSVLSFACLANGTRDEGMRDTAVELERWFWQDLALHYHAPSGTHAGPHCRSYYRDFEGGHTDTNMLLAMVYGKGPLSSTEDAFIDAEASGLAVFMDECERRYLEHQSFAVYLTQTIYHPDEAIQQLFFDKSYPLQIRGTYEQAGMGERSFPCRHGDITTYLTVDAAVGTADTGFLRGQQSNVFFFNYRRQQSAATPADIQTVYCRYLYEEAWPGPVPQPDGTFANAEKERCTDAGKALTVQEGGTALVAYHPESHFYPTSEEAEPRIRSLRLAIFFPLLAGREIGSIWLGDRPLPHQTGITSTVAEDDWITFHDGSVCYGFYPLLPEPSVSSVGRRIYVRRIGHYLALEFYNFQEHFIHPGRYFSPEDLNRQNNGFVFEFGPTAFAGQPEKFLEHLRASTLSDYTISGIRTLHYRRGDSELGMRYTPATMTHQYRTINGLVVPTDRLTISEAD